MANLKSETLCRQKEKKKKYRVDFPNLWGAQQPLGLMGCHMVRMEGERGSVTMMLNPRASFEKHWRLRIYSNCWREFCVVSCCIILKRGHYLCIVFISYFCQPQNVKQSVIAGIMGQRSPHEHRLSGCRSTRKWFHFCQPANWARIGGKMCLSADGTESKQRWKRLLSFPVHSLLLVGQIQSAVPAGGLQQQPTGHEGNSTHHGALFARRWGSVLQLLMWGLRVVVDECCQSVKAHLMFSFPVASVYSFECADKKAKLHVMQIPWSYELL